MFIETSGVHAQLSKKKKKTEETHWHRQQLTCRLFIQVTCSQKYPLNEVTQVAYYLLCHIITCTFFVLFPMLAGLETAASFPGTMNEYDK